MNAAFASMLKSSGIDFGRFLVGVVAALAEAKNPRYAPLIDQGATILDAHLATMSSADPSILANGPATAQQLAAASVDGGFAGSPRPGSPGTVAQHAPLPGGHNPGNAPDVPAPVTAPVTATVSTAASGASTPAPTSPGDLVATPGEHI